MTEFDQSKILERDENLRGEISNKDLIIKMLSNSLSQITNYFNKSDSIRCRGPTEKNIDRGKSELSQEKSSFNPKRLQKQVIIMV